MHNSGWKAAECVIYGRCPWQGGLGAPFAQTISIRPAQCITPTPSPAAELLLLQHLANHDQAASARNLPPREITIKMCAQVHVRTS